MKQSTAPKINPAIDMSREQMKIVIVGHVDHGKSTLIGRLFHDTDSLPDGKFEEIQALCRKRGMPFEWSFLMDALQAERDQGITIDTTQIWFKTEKRNYVIIDAPGHKEFLKNMISGAANSEAALLVIDAQEGVKEQSKRHGYLLHLLGVRQITVAVNKMDLVGYSEARFKEIETEYRKYLKSIGVEPTFIVPISAREGDNITGVRCSVSGVRSEEKPSTQHAAPNTSNMPWYKGPSILEAFDAFKRAPEPDDLPLRMPVQDVYKFDERRIIVGRVESGILKVGDEVIFSPANRTGKVKSIENFLGPQITSVSAGRSVGFTLEDQIFVERGHITSHLSDAPVLTNLFRARLFWLHEKPLKQGSRYKMKIGTSEYPVEVKEIEQVIDTGDLSHTTPDKLEKNGVGEILFRIRGLAALDAYEINNRTGRFVLMDGYRVSGGGIIDLEGIVDQRSKTAVKSKNIQTVEFSVRPEHRALMNGHFGGVLWFTGLSGSGKSTLAKGLQRRLYEKGYQVYVLDGDNIRQGLNADLGFSPEERTENIRRVGETAALFANAGIIVITAFIAPYKKDRDRARVAAGDAFHSIYIKADIATCEKRDVKGLYKKAKAGEIKDFTGISAPYEAPENADLVIDTTTLSVDESIQALVNYVEKNLVEPVKQISDEQVSI